MYKIGNAVVYKRNVCNIENIKEINEKNYYVLEPVNDKSLKITIPVENSDEVIRNVISKHDAEELINSITNIDIIKTNDKLLENEYKELLKTGRLEDLIKIIKTTYLRNENRIENHKKISEKDDNYFNKAENLLYSELSISLGLSFDDTKDYIKRRVEQLVK